MSRRLLSVLRDPAFHNLLTLGWILLLLYVLMFRL